MEKKKKEGGAHCFACRTSADQETESAVLLGGQVEQTPPLAHPLLAVAGIGEALAREERTSHLKPGVSLQLSELGQGDGTLASWVLVPVWAVRARAPRFPGLLEEVLFLGPVPARRAADGPVRGRRQPPSPHLPRAAELLLGSRG